MDRQGVIHDTLKEFGYAGTNEILNDPIHGLSNRNVVGMEIIARNDADVTAKQAAAAAEFMRRNYPNTPVYGHGQVNPGHKEATEGQKARLAVEADRLRRIAQPHRPPSLGPQAMDGAVPDRGPASGMQMANWQGWHAGKMKMYVTSENGTDVALNMHALGEFCRPGDQLMLGANLNADKTLPASGSRTARPVRRSARYARRST